MIIYVKGVLELIETDYVVVEVNGIGYEILMPQILSTKLPPCGNEVKIHTYDYIREDTRTLYGFITVKEKELFETVLTVNGIGPKVAMGLISSLSPSDIIGAIISEDIKSLTKAPGIGPKTAKRMILELKDKFSDEVVADVFTNTSLEDVSSEDNKSDKIDAIQALESLGYSKMDVMKVVGSVYTPDMDTQQILKESLKILGTI